MGTTVTIPSNTGSQQGYIVAVPAFTQTPGIDPCYTIQLLIGSTTTVLASAMHKLVDTTQSSIKITLLEWIDSDAKVLLSLGRVTH